MHTLIRFERNSAVTALLAVLVGALVAMPLAAEASDACEDLFRDLGGGAGGSFRGGGGTGDGSPGKPRQGRNPTSSESVEAPTDRRPTYGPPPRDCTDRKDCLETPTGLVADGSEHEGHADEAAGALLAAAMGPIGPTTGLVGGGDLVVYFAYDCPVSRDAALVLDSVVHGTTAARKQIRYRFISLDNDNVDLALASIAAAKHQRWAAFHASLMGPLDNMRSKEDLIARAAKAAGIEMKALRQDMESAETKEKLAYHSAQAEHRGVDAVPTYFVNGREVDLAQFLLEFDSPRNVMLKLRSFGDGSRLARAIYELYEYILGGLPGPGLVADLLAAEKVRNALRQ